MVPRPPRSTRTDTLFPDTTLFRARCAVMSALHRDELAHDALDKTVRGAEPKRDTLGLKPAREVGMREGDRMVRLDRVGGFAPIFDHLVERDEEQPDGFVQPAFA